MTLHKYRWEVDKNEIERKNFYCLQKKKNIKICFTFSLSLIFQAVT